MNCDAVRRRLLALERPDAPPPEVRKHLEHCQVCRGQQEQLRLLESATPQLPVPPPVRRDSFLQRLRDDPSVVGPAASRSQASPPFRKRERGLRKMAVAVALAAGLMLIAVGAWLWPRGEGTPQPSGPSASTSRTPLEERLEGDARWRQARTSRDRVIVLDQLAGELEGGVLALTRSRDDLEKQLSLYRQLIDRLTITEAPRLSAEVPDKKEREIVLDPIARRLAQVDSRARQLARERPDLAAPLRELALVAADGDRKLRALFA